MDRDQVGKTGEDLACVFLERKGFFILDRNYRKPWGEIDIIARKGNSIRFVEVKTVSREKLPNFSRETRGRHGEPASDDYRPEEMVHPAKLQRIARTAELYMADRGEDDFQIDVVGVFLDVTHRRARCRLMECVS